MIEPTVDLVPQNEAGDYIKLTLSMTAQEREWIEERAEERGMNLSKYTRAMAVAGERQLIALERLAYEDDHREIEADIIERLPEDEADAVPADELLNKGLNPVREAASTLTMGRRMILNCPEPRLKAGKNPINPACSGDDAGHNREDALSVWESVLMRS